MRVEIQVDLGNRRAKQKPPFGAQKAKQTKWTRQQRLARLLALAHHFDHMIPTGQARDMADLARMTGVSRARISQIMELMLLAPNIQEQVLAGSTRLAEHDLRRVAQIPEWKLQRSQLD